MTPLTPDCATCAALCCMAFAFEPGEAFPIEKAAGAACPNLTGNSRCSVHAARDRLGFHGCIVFDCLGAGQRVTQEVFGGRHWRDDPALTVPMIEAFRAMRKVHGFLELVAVSERLPLGPDLAAERTALLAALDPAGGWDAAGLARFEGGALEARVQAYLASLKGRADAVRPASA